MKQLSIALLLTLSSLLCAQTSSERKSPLITTVDSIGGVTISLQYGSPAVRGRSVWGVLVPYDKVWRTGANEATTVSFSHDVVIENQNLEAGRYSLFTIPSASDWTIIFNKVADQWGAYDYDQAQDALRLVVTPRQESAHQERMQITVTSTGLQLRWADLLLPISVIAN